MFDLPPLNESKKLFPVFPFSHSENYLVKWSSSGLVKDLDQLHNLRAVFTVRTAACLRVCVCDTRARVLLPVVARCLFSHVMRHAGALFAESVFVKLSRKEPSSLSVFTEAVTSV